MSMELTLKGKQGKTVIVTGDVVRIVKEGFFTGRNERTLPIRNISSVEVKKPGGFTGFIQFSIAGGAVRDRSYTLTGGAYDAVQDENSILFNGEQEYQLALRIKSYIESWSSAAGQAPAVTATSVADEIRKLKSLLDEGVLSRDEFEQQKKKLLGT
jgi:hypothetical protein